MTLSVLIDEYIAILEELHQDGIVNNYGNENEIRSRLLTVKQNVLEELENHSTIALIIKLKKIGII